MLVESHRLPYPYQAAYKEGEKVVPEELRSGGPTPKLPQPTGAQTVLVWLRLPTDCHTLSALCQEGLCLDLLTVPAILAGSLRCRSWQRGVVCHRSQALSRGFRPIFDQFSDFGKIHFFN
jgi:hypothetical protein